MAQNLKQVTSLLSEHYKWKITVTLPTKVHLVQAMVFPVVIYGCKGCITKKADRQRIDVYELWCWRRLFRVLDCKESKPVHSKGNQS